MDNISISKYQSYFFIGIAGAGMSAIAQYLSGIGKSVTGSDRLFKESNKTDTEQKLNAEGIKTFLQDGSGIDGDIEAFVVSTAVEEKNPEYQKAMELNIPIIHRADLLAAISRTKKTVAVAGTSGKSTTSAMICHIMEKAGKPISFIGGAGLISLQNQGKIGNAVATESEWLVIEADESDGSLVKYNPEIGLILNIEKDHKELTELEEIFQTFKDHIKAKVIVNQSNDRSCKLSENIAFDFGLDLNCGFQATKFKQNGFQINFELNHVVFEIPLIGKHNMENAAAAVAACSNMGVSIEDAAKALKSYQGIYRRHQLLGKINDFYIVDDYAHNPAKLAASIRSCQFPNSKLIVWFQPHGYKPTRFLRKEFVKELSQVLREEDELWMSEIYYAGGTAIKDISAKDLVDDISKERKNAFFVENREKFPEKVKSKLKAGDVLLLTGARDPSLVGYAKYVYQAIGENGISTNEMV